LRHSLSLFVKVEVDVDVKVEVDVDVKVEVDVDVFKVNIFGVEIV
jgi:hypothetical protein